MLHSLLNIALDRYRRQHDCPEAHIRAALIDMDGTLYDSMPLHVKAWSRLLTELNIPHNPDEIYLHEGMTGRATLQKLFAREGRPAPTDEELHEYYRRKTEYFSAYSTPPPMPGAAEMLKTLERKGIKRVLVTGSGQHSLIDRLAADFPGAFTKEMMVTSADVNRGKPDPEPYLIAMDKAGVEPHQAMVVENAPLGVESGHRAGCFTVGLTTGPIPEEILKQAGADIVYPSMEPFAHDLASL